MRIDQARRDDTAGEPNQMRTRADQRLELAERPEREDCAASNRDRVAGGMAQDRSFMQNEVSLERHQGIKRGSVGTLQSAPRRILALSPDFDQSLTGL